MASESTPFNLFLCSNIIFLVVWITYVIADLQWAILVQLLAFPALLAIDHRLRRGELISSRYLLMRTVATALACFSLLSIFVS